MSWIESLQGQLNPETTSLLSKHFEVFNQLSKYDDITDSIDIKNIPNDLLDFNSYKKEFIEVCNIINRLIKIINESELWIPSRYATEMFDELLATANTCKKEDIENLLLKYVTADIDSEKIVKEWKKSKLFSVKIDILIQAIEVHQLGYYAPSITCFLSQLDDIIVEISKGLNINKNQRNASRNMIEDICNFIDNKIKRKDINKFIPTPQMSIGNIIKIFQTKSFISFLKDITFADTKYIEGDDKLSRHGILHGKFLASFNILNSTKLILLIDDLNTLYEEYVISDS